MSDPFPPVQDNPPPLTPVPQQPGPAAYQPYDPAAAAWYRDQSHLNTLSVCYYILSGLTALYGCIPIIHLILGIVFVTQAPRMGHGGPPVAIGWIFIGVGLMIILFAWTMAAMLFTTARYIKQRRGYTFCFVIACIACLQMPMGTVLGIFTIVVLQRPGVRAQFKPTRPM